MIFCGASGKDKAQRGFTLIELLIAITITGFISSGIAMGIMQTIATTTRNSNHTAAIKQVQNIGHWFERDVKMAQEVQVDEGDSGLPLVLSWVGWDGAEYEITYFLEGNELKRSYSVDGGEPSVLLVAESVDPSLTNCQLVGNMLILEVSVTVGVGSGAVTETAVFRAEPRTSR